MRYKNQITAVYVFRNGMIAVFNQYGQQMPFFQGRRDFKTMKRIKDRINRQKPCNVEWKIQDESGVVTY